MTPSGTAVETARISVQIDSASVGSRRWAISSATVFLKKKLSPKLPCSMLPSQMPNCCQIGRLRPSFSRMSAIWSEVALSPAITAAGSPGVSRSMRKTNSATTARTGMMETRRRAMKSSMRPCVRPQALVTFHMTGTGALSQPWMFLRAAPGPYHWPIQPYCAVSIARSCTALASCLAFAGSVSLA